MRTVIFFVAFMSVGNLNAFEVYSESYIVNGNESSLANKTMEAAPQPSHLLGRAANKVMTDLAKGLKEIDMSKAGCYKIKNDALKNYCERGESACGDFGLRSNKEKFGIPDWVEDFCRSNYSIKDKNLDEYYRSGYTLQFADKKTTSSADKYKDDIKTRKQWVIYFANSVLLKGY